MTRNDWWHSTGNTSRNHRNFKEGTRVCEDQLPRSEQHFVQIFPRELLHFVAIYDDVMVECLLQSTLVGVVTSCCHLDGLVPNSKITWMIMMMMMTIIGQKFSTQKVFGQSFTQNHS